MSSIVSFTKGKNEKEYQYRHYLFEIEQLSVEQIDSEKIEKEICAIITKEIVPKIREVNQQKKEIWEKLFGESIQALFSPEIVFPIASMPIIPKIPVLSAHLLPNISYIDILIYSTTFFGLKVAPKIIESIQRRLKLRKNSIAFLVDFK